MARTAARVATRVVVLRVARMVVRAARMVARAVAVKTVVAA